MDKIEDEKSSQGYLSSASSVCASECEHGALIADSPQPALLLEPLCPPLEIKSVKQASELNEMASSNDIKSLDLSDFEKGASIASRNTLIREDVEISTKLNTSEHSPQFCISSEIDLGQLDNGVSNRDAALYQYTESKIENMNTGLVETETAFESVKEAVSKFGGITDWKAHKDRVWERRRSVQQELEKIRLDIPQYKKLTETAEDTKAQVLKELDETKKLIEELKTSLEKAQTEEEQVKQDALLADMRVKEMEQGIAGEASVALKVQIDVAKARHAAAVAELDSVKGELEALKAEHGLMINERNGAIKTAEAAAHTSKVTEKAVEDLTLELIIAKEALESAQTAHMEAEENRIGVALAKDQNKLSLGKELEQAEAELNQLNDKFLYVKDLRSKLQSASTLLLNLNGELAAYMEAQLNHESHDTTETPKEVCETHTDIEEVIASTKKEIEEVKIKIEKKKEEIKFLGVAAASLQSELETEKATLSDIKQREVLASTAFSSLEAELNKTRKEIEVLLVKEREATLQMVELPKALQQATLEADEAKTEALQEYEELRKAKEEAEQIRDSARAVQSRLDAALKEVEAAKASGRLAMAAVRACDEATSPGLDGNGITISLDEYYRLSKRAHDAEELAKEKVAAAISLIEVAKASEARLLEKLEETWREVEERKEALQSAANKAEDAKQGKLGVEQELRMRRAESERRQKASEPPPQNAADTPSSPRRSFEGRRRSKSAAAVLGEEDLNPYPESPASGMTSHSPQIDLSIASPASKPKKKKSLLPRIVMFLSKKK